MKTGLLTDPPSLCGAGWGDRNSAINPFARNFCKRDSQADAGSLPRMALLSNVAARRNYVFRPVGEMREARIVLNKTVTSALMIDGSGVLA